MSDHKPNKCYYKPHRTKPRFYTESDVARIFCQAKKDTGATELGFIAKCKCWDQRIGKEGLECIEQRAFLEEVLSFLAAALAVMVVPEGLVIGTLAKVLRGAAKVIPALERTQTLKLLRELPRLNREIDMILDRSREVLRR